MQLVIKILEGEYETICSAVKKGYVDGFGVESVYRAIAEGTPLPKGHGHLIDADELKANINGWYDFMRGVCSQPYMTLSQKDIIGKIDMQTTIIEAGEGSEET